MNILYNRNVPCPKCGSTHTEIDVSCVLTTYPPQYRYECIDCNHIWTGFGEAKIGPITSWPDLEQGVSVEPLNYGWICPKCGRVYSPSTSQCLFCGGTYSPNIVYCGPNNGTKEVFDTITVGDQTYYTNGKVSISAEDILKQSAQDAAKTKSQIKKV